MFSYLSKVTIVESKKQFLSCLGNLQKGFYFLISIKFDIKIRKGEILNDPEIGLFHIVDKIFIFKKYRLLIKQAHHIIS